MQRKDKYKKDIKGIYIQIRYKVDIDIDRIYKRYIYKQDIEGIYTKIKYGKDIYINRI